MDITEGLREHIINNTTVTELRRVAITEGMYTLRRAGLMKVRDGVTTFEEVVKETM